MSAESLAIGFYAVIALALIGWVVLAIKRRPYSLIEAFFSVLNVLITRMLWRATVPRSLPIGSTQGALIIANHRSSVDPFFIQLAAGRKTHWMVTRESYENAVSGWFMKMTGAIPVSRRGVDTAATKQAIRLASSGELVGIFPEGRINETDNLMIKIRPGAAMIALKSNVPLIPCYIHGAPYAGSLWSPFLLRAKVDVKFGRPVDVSELCNGRGDLAAQREIMRRVVTEIARLAGLDNFEPEFAGRNWVSEEKQEHVPAS